MDVARPALLVAAVGAGAEHGVLAVTASLAAAAGALVAMARLHAAGGPVGRTFAEWSARLTGAAAIAAGVLLVVSGILGV